MAFFTLTIFLSAFLLFQVQPLIAKHILPWYGGGPGVWTACMLAFQVFLLIGYAYAHLLNDRLALRRQAIVHLAVLLLSLAFSSIAPGPEWRPAGGESPTSHILQLLAVHIGLPFVVLASSSPLLAGWFSRTWPSRDPYRLYALSNIGSLLALLSYPFVVEPAFGLDVQERSWSIGYGLFVLLCAAAAVSTFRHSPADAAAEGVPDADGTRGTAIGGGDTALWVALAATGSVLLLATTNRICQDLTVVPLLWVLPLAIYLLSFIICFDRETWYRRGVFLPLLAVTAAAVAWVVQGESFGWFEIALFALALFAGTMVCHGELVRAKPAPRHLTRFYLAVAAGGALGGFFVGVIAPRLFPGYWEYPLGLAAAGLLAMVCVGRSESGIADGFRRRPLPWAGALVVLVSVAGGFAWREAELLAGALGTTRSFFGTIRVSVVERPAGPTRVMWHGRIAHGSQFEDATLGRRPTAYFGPESGAGIALTRYRALQAPGRALRVGVLGLGTGTLSAYGRRGDAFRFYEIDPEVEHFAREFFSYLDDSDATVDVVLGDARLMLEGEAARAAPKFDVLVLDVFTGDAVPVHLLTREAYETYLANLRPDGLLVFHVSNRYLDLAAVARELAEEAGQTPLLIVSAGDSYRATLDATYVIATENRAFLADEDVRVAVTEWTPKPANPPLWTDDSASLWNVMKKYSPAGKWDSAPNRGHFVVDRAGLLAAEDEVRVAALCRSLYDETNGAGAVAVVTAESMRAGGGAEAPFEDFTANLYHKLGLGRPEIVRGLLVFISKGDRRAGIHVGKSWPPAARERVQKLFETTAIAGLSRGQASRGISEFVEELEPFVRAETASR